MHNSYQNLVSHRLNIFYRIVYNIFSKNRNPDSWHFYKQISLPFKLFCCQLPFYNITISLQLCKFISEYRNLSIKTGSKNIDQQRKVFTIVHLQMAFYRNSKNKQKKGRHCPQVSRIKYRWYTFVHVNSYMFTHASCSAK